MNLTKHLAGLLAAAASSVVLGAPLLSEGFNDIATLPGDGWVLINDSAPPGSTGWFQGIPALFPAAAGPADSYIAANFNNAAFGGAVSNWLLTPQLDVFNGDALNFSLRLLGEGVQDRVEVYFSDSGASAAPGDFSLLSAYSSAVDTGWAAHSVVLNGLAAPASGRFAFRYVVDDTSLNGNYIGIDSVSVTAIPEPATIALIGLGALALRRRKRAPRYWLAALGLSSLAVGAQAGDNGVMQFPHVTVIAQPSAPAPAGQGGFMAYKDPVTGQLTSPNPEQAALLATAARASAPIARQAPPRPVRLQQGGVRLMLEERQARYSVARKAADGSASHSCEPQPGEQP